MENILDQDFEPNLNKRRNSGDWISVIALWFGIAWCFIEGLITNPEIVVALILLITSSILYFFNWNIGSKVLLGIILIGIFGIITFYPIQFVIFLFSIEFDLILSGILIIHILTNRKVIFPFIRNLFDKSDKDYVAESNSKVRGFKKRFAKHSISKLREISKNELLVPEAIKAALELIDEKNYADKWLS